MAALAAMCGLMAAQQPQNPNVLMLYVEDVNYDLGTFGHPTVKTPNLDILAQRATRFQRAYCPYPVCAPSRVATMLGLRASTTALVGNRFGTLATNSYMGVSILPKQFKDAGYATGGAGKLFHDGQQHANTWDSYTYATSDHWVSQPTNPVPQQSWRVLYGGPFMNGPQGHLGKMADTKHSDAAMNMMATLPQPWFIGVGYVAPHAPYVYPEAFEGLYDPSTVAPLPPQEASGLWKNEVPNSMWQSPVFCDPAWGATDDEQRRNATVHYWRTITFIDHEIGRVLKQLKTLDLEDDTIIVFVSDHGWSMGLHDRYGKFSLFDHEAKAPMLISVPWETSSHGETCTGPVSHLDIYPTLMDYCGLPSPPQLEGNSLRAQLQDPSTITPPVHTLLATSWETRWLHMVTSDRYKFIYHEPRFGQQQNMLFDLQTDPGEYNNLYNDPAHSGQVLLHNGLLVTEGLLDASWNNFGGGGIGSQGTPTLQLDAPPRLGTTPNIIMGNSSGQPAFGLLISGWASQRTTGPAVLGGPLLVTSNVQEPVQLSITGATKPLPIPSSQTLLGHSFLMQLLHYDVGASHNAAFSPGLRACIMAN